MQDERKWSGRLFQMTAAATLTLGLPSSIAVLAMARSPRCAHFGMHAHVISGCAVNRRDPLTGTDTSFYPPFSRCPWSSPSIRERTMVQAFLQNGAAFFLHWMPFLSSNSVRATKALIALLTTRENQRLSSAFLDRWRRDVVLQQTGCLMPVPTISNVICIYQFNG